MVSPKLSACEFSCDFFRGDIDIMAVALQQINQWMYLTGRQLESLSVLQVAFSDLEGSDYTKCIINHRLADDRDKRSAAFYWDTP